MVDGINNLYSQYTKKYPTLKNEDIINLMVQDGVISTSDAKALQNGVSVFNIKDFFNFNIDTTATEIWGGHFSKSNKETEPNKTALSKPHNVTPLIEVDKNGEIYNSQFTIEGIRKRFKDLNYNVIETKDEYGSLITVTDTNNHKVLEYDITNYSDFFGRDVKITKYNTSDNNASETVLLIIDTNNKTRILRHDIINEQESFATFFEYENPDYIHKTYAYKKIDGEWKFDEITLYSNNKPYKKFDGTYDNTIINYIAEELIELLNDSNKNNPAKLLEATTLIKSLNNKNIYEVLYDYQKKTGEDLLEKIEDMSNSGKTKFGTLYTTESQFGHQMYEHLNNIIKYTGSLDSDSWLNNHREEYIAEKLIKSLNSGNTERFKESLKLAGINLNSEKSILDIFGNTMIRKVLLSFQEKANVTNENSETTKGLLYAIATNKNIVPKERADILLDLISQLGFLQDTEIKKEISDFTKSDEFMDLMTKYCTEGKYCDDILTDMKLHKNDPDRILVDFKRLKSRNALKTENIEVTKPNGKIDVDFKQGNTGDCWLLAGVISLCKKENGKNKLESLLKINNKTGDVTVTLKGVNKTYKITAQEIEDSDYLSGGDGDMRALELAFDKYIRELAYNKEVSSDQVDIQGNTTHYLYQILLGDGNDLGKYNKTMGENFNNTNNAYCLGCGIYEPPFSETIEALTNSKGEAVDFVTGHAYAVEKADDKYVYLVNPWDSSDTLKITHEKLEKLNVSVGGCSY